jgi:uncharacterized protein YjiK
MAPISECFASLTDYFLGVSPNKSLIFYFSDYFGFEEVTAVVVAAAVVAETTLREGLSDLSFYVVKDFLFSVPNKSSTFLETF